jgi:glutaredoxin
MSITIYTATGCTRCKIVKSYMDDNNIPYLEKDMKAEAKEEFQKFYKENRNAIYRSKDGIEFPIITDGREIRQGISGAIAYLIAGTDLDGFFSVGSMRKEWINGINISTGKGEYAEAFVEVLRFLKKNNMKLQIETDGRNSHILGTVVKENLADKLIMNVLGGEDIYKLLLGDELDFTDIKNSIALVPKIEAYQYQFVVSPVKRENGEVSYLTPEEAADAAQLIENVTGSKKHSFVIKLFDPSSSDNDEFKKIEGLPSSALFSYRTKARNYQVFAEIEK